MNWFIIPLVNIPQIFNISLAGVNYNMTVKWNEFDEGTWLFDLENSDTNTPLLFGAPFVTGTNLLANLEYLGIGGSLIVYTNGDPSLVPTFDNLGSDANLYFLTDATVN